MRRRPDDGRQRRRRQRSPEERRHRCRGALRPRLPLQRIELGRDRAAHAGAQRPSRTTFTVDALVRFPSPRTVGDFDLVRKGSPAPTAATGRWRSSATARATASSGVVGDGDRQRRAAAGRQPLAPDQLRQADRERHPRRRRRSYKRRKRGRSATTLVPGRRRQGLRRRRVPRLDGRGQHARVSARSTPTASGQRGSSSRSASRSSASVGRPLEGQAAQPARRRLARSAAGPGRRSAAGLRARPPGRGGELGRRGEHERQAADLQGAPEALVRGALIDTNACSRSARSADGRARAQLRPASRRSRSPSSFQAPTEARR